MTYFKIAKCSWKASTARLCAYCNVRKLALISEERSNSCIAPFITQLSNYILYDTGMLGLELCVCVSPTLTQRKSLLLQYHLYPYDYI